MIQQLNIAEELKDQLTKREYGEHIYGARKDDYVNMSQEQRQLTVKKDKIWKTLDMQAMYNDGMPRPVIVFVSELRRSIMTAPKAFDAETCRTYVDNVSDIRDRAMTLRSYQDAKFLIMYCQNKFYSKLSGRYRSVNTDCIFSKYPDINYEGYYMRKAKKQGIGLSKEEQVRESLEDRYQIHLIDSTITISENGIEIRKSGSISYFYPKIMPSLNEGEYLLTDNYNRNAATFKAKEEAYARKETLINLHMAAMKPASKSSGKKSFKLQEVVSAKRVGPDYIEKYCTSQDGLEAHVTGTIMEDVLGFDKGQYGNYVSVAGMIDSLDASFNAALDLATLLKLPKKSISFYGGLGLAFGARGRSDARAHYEPGMKVINITYDQNLKTTRNGCFAHEWAHALDHYLGSKCSFANGLTFASDHHFAPQVMKDLVKAMKYKITYVTPDPEAQKAENEKVKKNYLLSYTNGYRACVEKKDPTKLNEFDRLVNKIATDGENTVKLINELSALMKTVTGHVIPKDMRNQLMTNAHYITVILKKNSSSEPVKKTVSTEFLQGSEYFDRTFKKSGNGYWASTVEMFARAFQTYIEDKMKEAGIRSDYLSCNADAYTYDGYHAVPMGEERKIINQKFDELFNYIRSNSIITQ